MAGAASDEQAARLVQGWLLDRERFCIAPDGDFAMLHDDCYWGLPSIQRGDPAFPPLGYWRGYTWGPMAMLTYWSVQQYDHVPVVRKARKALCKQLTAMMLNMWRRHRHICENFNPHRNATECSGTRFYRKHHPARPRLDSRASRRRDCRSFALTLMAHSDIALPSSFHSLTFSSLALL